MPKIPRPSFTDSTLAFLRQGYAFGPQRFEKLDTDIFETRLLLQPAIFLRGEAAARLFYDPDRFRRRKAAPERVVRTLFGRGGVQGLDGEAHRSRKAMLMSLMTPESIDHLAGRVAERWDEAIDEWARHDCTVLFDALHPILLAAVCEWAGVPLEDSEANPRTADIAAMIDGAGGVGPRHWRGRAARKRANAWIEEIIHRARAGDVKPGEDRPLHVVAHHRDPHGSLLDPAIAAVEVLNLLRPTVAIARFITFCALALHEYPQTRQRVADEPEYRLWFVQEVRRFYPFFPAVAARVREDFEWEGYRFEKGTRTMLDLYATDHHPRLWNGPEAFHPDRFDLRQESEFDLIPQGGGDYWKNHRCAGEWITVAVMNRALDILTNRMVYEVPRQRLEISLSRIPALPASRFIMSDVRRK